MEYRTRLNSYEGSCNVTHCKQELQDRVRVRTMTIIGTVDVNINVNVQVNVNVNGSVTMRGGRYIYNIDKCEKVEMC